MSLAASFASCLGGGNGFTVDAREALSSKHVSEDAEEFVVSLSSIAVCSLKVCIGAG